jgi:regulator of protease activity HflC (stomatin/prohibitin superfamily)
MISLTYIFLGFIALVFLFFVIFLIDAVLLVRQAEAIIIERFGRYDRTLGPGLHLITPFVDRPRVVFWTYVQDAGYGKYHRITRAVSRLDMREAVYDFPKQNIITKDNVTMEINALLYYQITDPKSATYEVANLPEAIEKLTQATLRNVIGSLDLDETLVSRDRINEKLRIILDDATNNWGVKVNRVELQDVNPPADIRNAMEKQMRAERDRRAVILEAEGRKQAEILEAEGRRQANILDAEGHAQARVINADAEAQARLKVAQAEAQALAMIQDVAKTSDAVGYAVALNYLKVLPKLMEGKNDKLVIVPYESSSLVGSLATIKSILEYTQQKPT